ncbi:hypothetical protein DVH24_013125 [Malus domestica]|uniref:Uncharacterized protein n=1 Tax=Malus domestica TaxID=3750 RepID=A0A498IL09_MALDO|nr:hypothetical protein DVH24_013125 [Malus domestica]
MARAEIAHPHGVVVATENNLRPSVIDDEGENDFCVSLENNLIAHRNPKPVFEIRLRIRIEIGIRKSRNGWEENRNLAVLMMGVFIEEENRDMGSATAAMILSLMSSRSRSRRQVTESMWVGRDEKESTRTTKTHPDPRVQDPFAHPYFNVLRTMYAYMCILESFGAVFVHQMDCICLEQTHGKEKNVAAHTWEHTAWQKLWCEKMKKEAANFENAKTNVKAKGKAKEK